MKRRYYVLIAVLSYLLFTLINTPAATVLSLAEKNMRLPAKIYGAQGSIWNGQADNIIVPGQPRIDNVSWSINPLALFIARLSADIEAEIKQQKVVGQVAVNSSGTLSASNVRSRLNASDIQQLAAIPFGELDGVFNISIDELEWDNKGLPIITGTINWQNAKLTLVEAVSLGNIDISIKPGTEKDLVATIKNSGGEISIEGTASLMDNRRYSVDIEFKPQNNARDSIKQSLGMFARRQPNGAYQFKNAGNLNQLRF